MESDTTAMENETLGKNQGIVMFPATADERVSVREEAALAKSGEAERVLGLGRRGPDGGQTVME
jgi:malic enzyme